MGTLEQGATAMMTQEIQDLLQELLEEKRKARNRIEESEKLLVDKDYQLGAMKQRIPKLVQRG